MAKPNLQHGLKYWENQEASIDGVLGGYGKGFLPRVDALSSRQFLLSVLPRLCKVESPLRPQIASNEEIRTRALDVGAGVGRVTGAVLLHLVTDVVLVEPVQALINEAVSISGQWKGIQTQEKSVIFVDRPLQTFDPSLKLSKDEVYASVGASVELDSPATYDVIWCQWCLGHLSNKQLVRFFKQAHSALRPGGVIIVKENCCAEPKPGEPDSIYDPDDSSVTRPDSLWLRLFDKAGLRVIRQEIQRGFPPELYVVKSYVTSLRRI